MNPCFLSLCHYKPVNWVDVLLYCIREAAAPPPPPREPEPVEGLEEMDDKARDAALAAAREAGVALSSIE